MMSGEYGMRPERRFLLVCLANTCGLLGAMVLPAPPILRTLIALPLIFVLPGEAALRALALRFEPIARIPIVVGLSMALTLSGGLILDCFGGLTPGGWVAWLGAAALVPATLARGGVAVSRLTVFDVKIRHALMVVATCAVLAVAFHGTIRGIELYHPFRYTDFWMVPLDEATNAYAIGIKNGEGKTESYTVRFTVEQRLAGEWQNIVLAPEHSLILPIAVPLGASAEARLFHTEQPDSVYRTVNVAGEEEMGAITVNDAGGGG
jgi:hypothetical protein